MLVLIVVKWVLIVMSDFFVLVGVDRIRLLFEMILMIVLF